MSFTQRQLNILAQHGLFNNSIAKQAYHLDALHKYAGPQQSVMQDPNAFDPSMLNQLAEEQQTRMVPLPEEQAPQPAPAPVTQQSIDPRYQDPAWMDHNFGEGPQSIPLAAQTPVDKAWYQKAYENPYARTGIGAGLGAGLGGGIGYLAGDDLMSAGIGAGAGALLGGAAGYFAPQVQDWYNKKAAMDYALNKYAYSFDEFADDATQKINMAKEFASRGIDAVGDAATTVGNYWSPKLESAGEYLKTVPSTVSNYWSPKLESAGDYLKTVPGTVSNYWGPKLESAKDSFDNAVIAAADKEKQALQYLKEKASNAFSGDPGPVYPTNRQQSFDYLDLDEPQQSIMPQEEQSLLQRAYANDYARTGIGAGLGAGLGGGIGYLAGDDLMSAGIGAGAGALLGGAAGYFTPQMQEMLASNKQAFMDYNLNKYAEGIEFPENYDALKEDKNLGTYIQNAKQGLVDFYQRQKLGIRNAKGVPWAHLGGSLPYKLKFMAYAHPLAALGIGAAGLAGAAGAGALAYNALSDPENKQAALDYNLNKYASLVNYNNELQKQAAAQNYIKSIYSYYRV